MVHGSYFVILALNLLQHLVSSIVFTLVMEVDVILLCIPCWLMIWTWNYMLIGHLYIVLSEVSAQICFPFYCVIPLHYWGADKSFLRCMFINNFFHFVMVIYFLSDSSSWVDVLFFTEVQIIICLWKDLSISLFSLWNLCLHIIVKIFSNDFFSKSFVALFLHAGFTL